MTDMLVAADSDTVWTGRLYAAGADPKYDDPVWSCDHGHATQEAAEKCARREAWRLGLESEYARQEIHGARDDTERQILARLDEAFLFAEKHYGALGPLAVTGICNRYREVYRTALKDHGLPQAGPAGRNSFFISRVREKQGMRTIMRAEGDDRVNYLVISEEYAIDALSAIRMAYERGQRERTAPEGES